MFFLRPVESRASHRFVFLSKKLAKLYFNTVILITVFSSESTSNKRMFVFDLTALHVTDSSLSGFTIDALLNSAYIAKLMGSTRLLNSGSF